MGMALSAIVWDDTALAGRPDVAALAEGFHMSPARVYLASLGPGSQRETKRKLTMIVETLLPGNPPKGDDGHITIDEFPWREINATVASAVRTALQGRYAPASVAASQAPCRRRSPVAWSA